MRLLTLLSLLLLCGCGPKYYLVETRLVEGERPVGDPEVTATPRYREILPSLQRVALRAPDGCEQLGATDVVGESKLSSGVLRKSCGVQMFELERALSEAGFSVISWDAVANTARHDQLPPLRAAERLGAEAMFQINALERATTSSGNDARLEHRFFSSTEEAKRGPAVKVPEERAKQLDELAQLKDRELQPGKRPSATINANAVWVETGESIWYYRWTRTRPRADEQSIEQLVACEGERCRRARMPKKDAQSQRERSGSIRAVSSGGDPADELRADHYELIREVIEDMVSRFAGGRS